MRLQPNASKLLSLATPYVNVKITHHGVTTEQMKQIVTDITNSLVNTSCKKLEHIHIVIDEIDPENWGSASKLITEYRSRKE